jgi:hypothetical protein
MRTIWQDWGYMVMLDASSKIVKGDGRLFESRIPYTAIESRNSDGTI